MSLHAPQTQDETSALYRILFWGLVTIVPMLALVTAMAVVADSVALAIIALQYLVSLVVNCFAVYALRQVLRKNAHSHPYGAGKLENFSAFLCGVLYVPSAAYAIYAAVLRLMDPPPVSYGLTLVVVAVSLARGVALYVALRRVSRRSPNPSPLLVSYRIDYRISVLIDAGVLVAFAAGLALVANGPSGMGERIDPIVTLVLAAYMLRSAVGLIRNNFRALMDLPLPEEHQMAVTRVIAKHYADFDCVGYLCTRASGNRRYVELELGFDDDRTLGHVRTLSSDMEHDLAEQVPGLRFRIVPVWQQQAADGEEPSGAGGDAAG